MVLLEQSAEQRIKPVFAFLPASPVWEHVAEASCLLGEQGGGEKLAVILSSWHVAHQIFLRSGQLSCSHGKPQTPFFSDPGRG
jgi:hypothetical protein